MVLALLIWLAAACMPDSTPRWREGGRGNVIRIDGTLQGDLSRFVDLDAGVVCWVIRDWTTVGLGVGMSCLPIEETRLE